MAAEGMQFPWRWNGSTISVNLKVIWEMSIYTCVVRSVVASGVLCLGLALSATARSADIFDNGPPDFGGPVTSDLGPDNFVAADNFRLQEGKTVITSVQWYGGYAGDIVKNVDDFTIRIFEDIDGAPALTPTVLDLHVGHVTRELVAEDTVAPRTFKYLTNMGPIELTADTTYYVSIANNSSVGGEIDWGWNASATDTEKAWGRLNDTGPWTQPGAIGRAFKLGGSPCKGFIYPVALDEWHLSQDYAEQFTNDTNNPDLNFLIGQFHSGQDWNLGSGRDDVGESVHAISDGEVIFVRNVSSVSNPDKSIGDVIVIRHSSCSGSEVYSFYLHVDAKSSIKPGKKVFKGQCIATVHDIDPLIGLSPHLHFEIRDSPIDKTNLWPNQDKSGAYYASTDDLIIDGIISPSEFIDSNKTLEPFIYRCRTMPWLKLLLLDDVVDEAIMPMLSITADRTLVKKGDSTTITWSATGVDSCVVTGPSGFFFTGLSGSESTGPILGQSIYTLICETAAGPVGDSVIVNVVPVFGEF